MGARTFNVSAWNSRFSRIDATRGNFRVADSFTERIRFVCVCLAQRLLSRHVDLNIFLHAEESKRRLNYDIGANAKLSSSTASQCSFGIYFQAR